MDVKTLRDAVQAALTSHLGTYTLGNAATTPAISVRQTGESLPTGTTVSGLEAIIVRDPALDPVDAYRDQSAFQQWTVYLVDWSNTGRTAAAAAAVLAAFPGTRIRDLQVPEALGPMSQKRLTITTTP
jgi:hypothetical protein